MEGDNEKKARQKCIDCQFDAVKWGMKLSEVDRNTSDIQDLWKEQHATARCLAQVKQGQAVHGVKIAIVTAVAVAILTSVVLPLLWKAIESWLTPGG